MACLDDLRREKPDRIDLTRIGAVGISMGGYLALHLAVRCADVRAVCPIIATPEWRFQEAWSGWGLNPETEARVEHESLHRHIRAFRGKAVQMQNATRDAVSPIGGVRRFYRALEQTESCAAELHTVYMQEHTVTERMIRRAAEFLRTHL